ncbi:hypothetical protein Tco_0613829 [Tanacetum coccineum]
MTRLHRARIYVRPHTLPSPSTKALIAEYASAPTPPSPPPSSLSPLSSPLPRIPSPPLLLPPLHTSPTYASVPLGYKAAMVQLKLASPSIYHPLHLPSPPLSLPSTACRTNILEAEIPPQKRVCFTTPTHRVVTAVEEVNKRVTDLATTQGQDAHKLYAWSRLEDRSTALEASIMTLEAQKMAPKKTTTPMTDATIKQLIAQGVANALAEYEVTRNSGNGDHNHDSGSGRRTKRATCECTYSDFLKCQPLNFKGTEGVFGLSQWFEKIKYVFHISNCTVACQTKFATCTLLGNTLTWCNSHVKTVGHDVAYEMTWKTLKKMMTNKHYLRSEIKKLEIEISNLKVKGTDVGSVMASKPKTMQEAIEFSTDLMGPLDPLLLRKAADNQKKGLMTHKVQQLRIQNNLTQKWQNVAMALHAGHGEKMRVWWYLYPVHQMLLPFTMVRVHPSATIA